MRHVVFNQDNYNCRGGGPGGYISRLYRGYGERGSSFVTNNDQIVDINIMFADSKEGRYPWGQILDNIKNDSFNKELLNLHASFRNMHEESDWGIYDSMLSLPSIKLMRQMYLDDLASIHVHGSYDFFKVLNILKLNKIENDVVKILTTHSPVPLFQEIYEDNLIAQFPNNKAYCDDLKRLLTYRELLAYRNADVLIFPIKEAIDSYYEYSPELGKIIDSKPVYYFLTGSAPYEVKTPVANFRCKYNIPLDAKVVGYIGRHVVARGYDTLKEAAIETWAKDPNVYFVMAGELNAYGEQPITDDNRWIEIGFTDCPGDFINSLDLVIQPSKHNYFDLSMIEILSLGKIVLTSYVGGMKYFADNTSGVITFERYNASSLANKIVEFFKLESKELNKMKNENLDLYNNHHNEEIFSKEYTKVISQIYQDFKIKEPKIRDIQIPGYISAFSNRVFSKMARFYRGK
ncbi:glycosyltransferase [Paenibacillus sp. GCM10027628]|uniref:glycosyltransferase n=1 Tax=Paenibacillus sp. GCM10027628 TaxID=3273413 RepID=UPI0036386144